MSPEVRQIALDWFKEHRPRITARGPKTEPTGSDLFHPELWKRSHWRWFLSQEYPDQVPEPHPWWVWAYPFILLGGILFVAFPLGLLWRWFWGY